MEPVMKRSLQKDVVGGVRWDAMNSEILAQIFLRVSPSADEIIRTVSLVCRGWLEVVVGPYCWSEIDVGGWCRNTQRRDIIDSVVRKLVRRSRCTLRSLSAFRLGNVGFAYVATCGRFLTTLRIPVSEITDDMVAKHAVSLVNLKELDISYCYRITYKGLSYFGKCCHSLTNLKRNLIPSILSKVGEEDAFLEIDDDEAYAIANTMQGLCRLELANSCFGDGGLNDILTNCKSLTHLDIEGCHNVSLGGDLKEQCERLLVFKNPFDDSWNAEESTESGSSEAEYDEESSVHTPCSSDSY